MAETLNRKALAVLRHMQSRAEVIDRKLDWYYGPDLAKHFGFSLGRISAILCHLEARGLIHSEWDDATPEGQSRKRYYQITDAGLAVDAPAAKVEDVSRRGLKILRYLRVDPKGACSSTEIYLHAPAWFSVSAQRAINQLVRQGLLAPARPPEPLLGELMQFYRLTQAGQEIVLPPAPEKSKTRLSIENFLVRHFAGLQSLVRFGLGAWLAVIVMQVATENTVLGNFIYGAVLLSFVVIQVALFWAMSAKQDVRVAVKLMNGVSVYGRILPNGDIYSSVDVTDISPDDARRILQDAHQRTFNLK